MKKKIFLITVMIAMLVCIFAISASAETVLKPQESNEYGELSVVDGVPEPTVLDKNAKTVILVNGSYYTIPTYYLLADNSYFTWSVHANVRTAFGLGNDVRGNLVRSEIPEGIVTSYNGGNGGAKMESSANLIEASIPTSMEIMGDFFFGKCTAFTTVKGLENSKVDGIYKQAFYNTKITSISLPSTVKIIEQDAFRNTPITSIVIPDAVESIGDHAFASCTSLATITISENSQLKSLVGEYQFEQTVISSFYFPSSLESLGGGGAFYKCASLETLVNFENLKITDIPFRTFASGPKFPTITFPQGIVTIGDSAFNGHKITGDIILPNTVTTLGDHAFAGSNVKCGKLVLSAGLTTITGTYTFEKTDFTAVYIPATITAFPQGAFKETGENNGVYYYTGTLEQLNALKDKTATGDNGNFLNANVNYGYSACLAFYNGVHGEEVETVKYENGFALGGEHFVGCGRCNEGETTALSPIISALGFSLNSFSTDRLRIASGYNVEVELVKLYEEVTLSKLEIGVVFASKATLDGLIIANGGALPQTLNGMTHFSDHMERTYSQYSFKIEFPSPENDPSHYASYSLLPFAISAFINETHTYDPGHIYTYYQTGGMVSDGTVVDGEVSGAFEYTTINAIYQNIKK